MTRRGGTHRIRFPDESVEPERRPAAGYGLHDEPGRRDAVEAMRSADERRSSNSGNPAQDADQNRFLELLLSTADRIKRLNKGEGHHGKE
jgi:hypothetical protein